MQNLAKKTFIAIEAVVYIACNGGDRPVRSRDICEYQEVTLRYLEHIMQQLVKDGILRGVRGPRGGYLLAKDRRKIRLMEIYDSMERLNSDVTQGNSDLFKHVISPLKRQMKEEIREYLSKFTIQDMCDNASSSRVDVAGEKDVNFAI